MGENRLHCFKHTSDDWCGNYDRHYVEVIAGWLPVFNSEEPLFRVSVWGDDDLGMDKDFTSAEEGLALFHKILLMDDVTQEHMHSLGLEAF